VQEYSTPLAVDIDESAALPDAVREHAARTPDAVVFRRKSPGGWNHLTAKHLTPEVAAHTKGLKPTRVHARHPVGQIIKKP
jgi:long-chain acyl-CoA synthetase